MSSYSAPSRLPTLREHGPGGDLGGAAARRAALLFPDNQASERKNREEASKDKELQTRVDRLRERLYAMIEERRARDESGE